MSELHVHVQAVRIPIGSVEWLRWKLYNFWGFRDSCCYHYLIFTGSVETLGFWVNLQYTLYLFFQMTVMIHTLALLLIEDTSGFNVFHSVQAFHSGCYRPPFSCPFSSWYGYVVLQRLLLQEKRARYSLQCCVLCCHKRK